MTLHTRIAVLAPVPVRELFEFVNTELLRAIDPVTVNQENTDFDSDHFAATGERRRIPNGTRELGNKVGQGFDAWFWIDYRPDGPLHPKPLYLDENCDETDEPVEWAEDGEPSQLHLSEPAMALEINFDTGYAFDRDGAGCGDLHAYYITRLADWFAERGVDWSWYDEFAGEWHGNDLSELTRLYAGTRRCFGDPAKLQAVAS